MSTITLRYARYILTTLASIGFAEAGLAQN